MALAPVVCPSVCRLPAVAVLLLVVFWLCVRVRHPGVADNHPATTLEPADTPKPGIASAMLSYREQVGSSVPENMPLKRIALRQSGKHPTTTNTCNR